jgi:integrase/recombinase XerD
MALDCLEKFLQDCELRGIAQVTRNNYRYQVGWFLEFQQSREKNFNQATMDDLKEFLRFLKGKNYRGTSLSTIFSSISAFFEYLLLEGEVQHNPIREFRRRYLRSFKEEVRERQCISLEEARMLVNSVIDSRDRAIILLLLKTGIRRNELVTLDIGDINLEKRSLHLKRTAKRSNRELYFDNETGSELERWLGMRRRGRSSKALFIGPDGDRLTGESIMLIVKRNAERVGLHDPNSDNPVDHFTPHCCRHWFTTHLVRSGMPREYVKELRGDVRREALDLYNHIDHEDLRNSYLAHIPQLGI